VKPLGGRPRILIADDDEINRLALRRVQSVLRFERYFDVEALRVPDPLGSLRALIRACPDLSLHRTEIDLVVTELFSNALEHGLLKLSSSSKLHAAGFAAYYRQRSHALANLTTGGILVSLVIDASAEGSDQPEQPGRRAIIGVVDNGEGVEPPFAAATPFPAALPDATGDARPRVSGRGLHLVRSLCSEVTTRDGGRAVEAIFPLD
jgi:anti-sigma regulatory factor (Ser/Thr protein kinase)